MFCPNCGAKNAPDAVFCENCGTRLTPAATQQPTSQKIPTQPVTSNIPSRQMQTANKGPKKQPNKAMIGLIVALVVIIIGGGGYYFYHQKQVANNTAANTSSNETVSASSSSAAPTRTALWSTSKTSDLSSFMSSWEDTMNQWYIGTYDGDTVDVDGITLPDDIKNDDYEGNITVDGDDVTLKWSPKADTDKEYQVVAASVYNHNDDGESKMIAYLYVFHNGEPDVLVCEETGSSAHDFTSSRNQQLQNGFKKIANESN
jgi:cytoskeletal protein RodZ